ncbi:DUF6470 family protein [Fusibacter tunisiensis]|uniref:Uncharacterized protein n=1 Tax=Fusibacter tunisiensis TaxID=1008308 RepID=A0ABS2MPI8_9FIRM|nr:hypothetical protein [Fusibacter tunisiensis]
MPIKIESQSAQIGWDTKKAQLNQSGNNQQSLDIQTRKPKLEIRTTRPQMNIDQSQPFAEAGLKNIQAFMSDSVSYAKQVVSQGIDRIVSQGNEMKDIHTGVDPIPDQAIYNAYDLFEKTFNFALVPSSRPEINVTPGEVTTTLNPGEVINNTMPRRVQMDYTPWQISYYMKQYASIRFSFEPSKFETMV